MSVTYMGVRRRPVGSPAKDAVRLPPFKPALLANLDDRTDLTRTEVDHMFVPEISSLRIQVAVREEELVVQFVDQDGMSVVVIELVAERSQKLPSSRTGK